MYMFKYILKRLGLMIMSFTIIMIICFVLIKLLPIVINVQIGQDRTAIIARLVGLGYIEDPVLHNGEIVNVSILKQFVNYASRIFHGDFGIGINMADYRYASVLKVFLEKLPPTILINLYSVIFSVPLGLALGIFAALKKNRWQDHVISTSVMVVVSVPSYVYAFLIQYLFCFLLGWFPLRMNAGYEYFSFNMFRSMLPAVFALSFGSIAGYARFSRAELTEVLTSDFMLLARTKGLTRWQATIRHAMRNAMVPIFPMIIGEFISVLSGSLIIERIFAIPGVGNLYLNSINYLDYDFFMFLSGFYCLVGLLAGIIIDISYGIIDPRIRMGAK